MYLHVLPVVGTTSTNWYITQARACITCTTLSTLELLLLATVVVQPLYQEVVPLYSSKLRRSTCSYCRELVTTCHLEVVLIVRTYM
jgi:hypothetical protein